MSDERSTWDALASEYLRKVESALARTDHPRKKDVLSDLQRHMEERYAAMPSGERTSEGFRRAIGEMGSPEEYAELLSPATGVAARKWYRRRSIQALLGLAVVLVAAKIFLLPDIQTCLLYARAALGVNYAPAPFFTEKSFRHVQPGMSKDEVRELIGYPIQRNLLHHSDGYALGIMWEYSTVDVPGANCYRRFVVTIGAQTKRVMTVTDSGEFYAVGYPVPHVRTPRWVASLKKRIGTLRLSRLDGTTLVLKPWQQEVSLLCPVSSGIRHDLRTRLRHAVERMEKRFGWVKDKGGSILFCVVDETPERATLPPEEYLFVSSRPVLDRWTGVRVYKEGILYELPSVVGEKGDSLADQEWTVRHLLQ